MDNINASKESNNINNNGVRQESSISDEQITIDELDGIKKVKQQSTPQKDVHRDKKKESGKKERKRTEESLIEGLDDERIAVLLEVEKTLHETNKQLEEKSNRVAEYEDLLKRKQAEFENYRKRVQREIEEYKKYSTAEMVLDILNVLDDFERAIESADASKDFEAFLEGIILIKNQFRDILEKKHGVKKIESVGREFDPTFHDAIMMEESAEYEEDTVVEDFQRGYTMHDRIIRPAKVKVAKAVSSVNNANEADDSIRD
jgi:molecular chaperone GrpE